MDLIQIILLITLILFLVFILSFFRTPKIYTFKQEQFVKSDMETVFEFFSRPENLEKITPPAMSFNIMTPRPIEMKEGSIIDYTVKIVGIPTRWRTVITSYKKNEYFVDEQRFGPYSLWHHKHFIKEIDGGIEMEDVVDYKIPFGFLGQIAHPLFVKNKLRDIFKYREKKLIKLFGKL